jgi:hypothetical protein
MHPCGDIGQVADSIQHPAQISASPGLLVARPGDGGDQVLSRHEFLGLGGVTLFTGPAILPDSELQRRPLPFSMDGMAPWKGSLLIGASSVYLGKTPQQSAYRALPSKGGYRREMEMPVEG